MAGADGLVGTVGCGSFGFSGWRVAPKQQKGRSENGYIDRDSELERAPLA